jgi:hypothetical protein
MTIFIPPQPQPSSPPETSFWFFMPLAIVSSKKMIWGLDVGKVDSGKSQNLRSFTVVFTMGSQIICSAYGEIENQTLDRPVFWLYMCSMCACMKRHRRSCNAWHIYTSMHACMIIYIYKIKYIFLHWLFQGSSWWARVPVSRVTMISNCNGTIELSYLSVVFLLTAGLPPVVLLVCHRCNCSSISRASKSSKQVVPALNI